MTATKINSEKSGKFQAEQNLYGNGFNNMNLGTEIPTTALNYDNGISDRALLTMTENRATLDFSNDLLTTDRPRAYIKRIPSKLTRTVATGGNQAIAVPCPSIANPTNSSTTTAIKGR